MTAVKTEQLTKFFKEKRAVKGLDLCIEEGELFALLGVNGAGKTTVIKMLSGLLAPTAGDALIFGASVLKSTAQVKKLVGLSTQETAVAQNLTVRENLELMCGIYGFSREEARRRAGEVICEFGLSEVERQRAKTLSGGFKRRLSIAMALSTNPKILFLDEPTLGLDVLARRSLWAVIKKLRGKVTIVLTTHYLEEAQHLADRIAIMAGGELRALGTADELMARAAADNFEDAFVAICQEGVEV